MSHIANEFDLLCDISRSLDDMNDKLEQILRVLEEQHRIMYLKDGARLGTSFPVNYRRTIMPEPQINKDK